MPIYKTGKMKDGKTQYRVTYNYTDINGKYRQKTKLIYGANEAKIAETRLQLNDKESTSLTVHRLFEEYTATKSTEVRESTLAALKKTLENHVLPTLGSVRLKKLNTKILQDWKNSVADKPLKITTKQNIYRDLRGMLNYAVKLGYISRNPLLLIGNFKEPYFEIKEEKLHYYTIEQFNKFISQAEPSSDEDIEKWKYYVFFNIAFYTGMRKGEINALKWSDIEGNTIHVRRSIAQKIKGKPIVETPPKNKSSYRDILIPTKLVDILAHYKNIQLRKERFTDDFRVCGGVSCLSDTSIENRNKAYSAAAGLPHIRIHDFRHSHASLLVNSGILIQEVSRRLGHTNVEITWNTYSHLYPKQESAALEILEKL